MSIIRDALNVAPSVRQENRLGFVGVAAICTNIDALRVDMSFGTDYPKTSYLSKVLIKGIREYVDL